MQRRKDHLTYLEDPIQRNVTYCKRKKYITQKLLELGNLCDLKIYLMIFNPKKQSLYEYRSEDKFSSEICSKLVEFGTVQ